MLVFLKKKLLDKVKIVWFEPALELGSYGTQGEYLARHSYIYTHKIKNK